MTPCQVSWAEAVVRKTWHSMTDLSHLMDPPLIEKQKGILNCFLCPLLPVGNQWLLVILAHTEIPSLWTAWKKGEAERISSSSKVAGITEITFPASNPTSQEISRTLSRVRFSKSWDCKSLVSGVISHLHSFDQRSIVSVSLSYFTLFWCREIKTATSSLLSFVNGYKMD